MLQRLKILKCVDHLALTPRAASKLGCQPTDLLVGSAKEILSQYWDTNGVLLVVGAIGAVTRLVAPLLVSKEKDPAVIVIDANGMNFVPLLGGHKAGAENLALELAELLGGKAVITGHSRIQECLPLDGFGEAWGWERSGDSSAWHQLMVHQASGGRIRSNQYSGSKLWLNSEGAANSVGENQTHNSLELKSFTIGPKSIDTCCWHPSTIWVGIGCERGTSLGLLNRSLNSAFSQVGIAKEAIAGLISIDLKFDESALRALSKQWARPLRFFTASALSKVSVPTPSKEVESITGTPSVAEAAALFAAGEGGVLLMKKQIYRANTDEKGAATIAIAESLQPFAPQRGALHLIGSGPGDLAYLTHDARAALARCVVWIGYSRYLDLLEPIRRSDQVRIDGQLTFERQRCKEALQLAREGASVALISSGDSGIYGMAGLALELWLEQPEIDRPGFNIHPGISAMQIAAARAGAPLMNDFCTISLSDHLTPWITIKERLRGAAIGDFVIAIYNPRSKDRDWQLQNALDIIREYRSENTPIVFARQMGRGEEKIEFYSLGDCPVNKVDMLTLVLIGNSQSLLNGRWFVTPRGYLSD